MSTALYRTNFPQVSALQEAVDHADYIIGLDLHKKTTAMTAIDTAHPDTPVVQKPRLKNENLIGEIQKLTGNKVVVIEAAYGWTLIQTALNGMADITLIPLDARKTSAWVQMSGIKTDKVDAGILAYTTLRSGINQLAVYQSESTARERFKLVLLREGLVNQRAANKRKFAALTRDYCDANPYTGEIPTVSDEIAQMYTTCENTILHLDEQIQAIDSTIATLSADDVYVRLLRSIPGIGPLTAFALRWKIDDISRFENAAHLCSYFGLGIRQQQSGEHTVMGKITKTGNRTIRSLLVQGAQVIRHTHPEYISLYFPKMGDPSLMSNRIHVNKVVIALARKHLTFAYGVLKNKTPFRITTYRERRAWRAGITNRPSDTGCTISSRATNLETVLV
jgi:transposase